MAFKDFSRPHNNCAGSDPPAARHLRRDLATAGTVMGTTLIRNRGLREIALFAPDLPNRRSWRRSAENQSSSTPATDALNGPLLQCAQQLALQSRIERRYLVEK